MEFCYIPSKWGPFCRSYRVCKGGLRCKLSDYRELESLSYLINPRITFLNHKIPTVQIYCKITDIKDLQYLLPCWKFSVSGCCLRCLLSKNKGELSFQKRVWDMKLFPAVISVKLGNSYNFLLLQLEEIMYENAFYAL